MKYILCIVYMYTIYIFKFIDHRYKLVYLLTVCIESIICLASIQVRKKKTAYVCYVILVS